MSVFVGRVTEPQLMVEGSMSFRYTRKGSCWRNAPNVMCGWMRVHLIFNASFGGMVKMAVMHFNPVTVFTVIHVQVQTEA